MMAVMAAKPPGGAQRSVVAGERGLRGRTGAMDAPPERRRDQGVRRWPKRLISFVMSVMAAKPPGGSGATF